MRRSSMFYVALALMTVACVSGGCKRSRTKTGAAGMAGEGLTPHDMELRMGTDRRGFEDGQLVTGVSLQNVHFAYDSYQIEPGEAAKIEAVAEYMRGEPATRLVTEGHCDERGSNEYNMSLGEHRAGAIRAYLVGLGIGAERIQTRSFGEEQPLDAGHDESAWSQNRRGEFKLYK